MGERRVCIHGHFYQPPRENPWSGEIEPQPSAHPHRDWNVRITEECYRPNAAARLLDETGRRRKTVNNYAGMSFDFGPTLLDWLERHAGDVYAAILEADRTGGGALAQAHGHLILPLASARDKACQVAWGVRDFEHRFRRKPEGMWLPETAADVPTLEALAAAGLRFTVLAPHQARRTRTRGSAAWQPASEASLDTTVAYEQALPSGRRIALFFYDAPAARAIAFEGLLRDGATFAARLAARLPRDAEGPRLASVATDGESYGHHHVFGEMALAWALEHFAGGDDVRTTHYGAFLRAHPPTHEVEIVEPTSWSCPHGVERWRADCGCGAGIHPGWSQAWRAPLREALDGLRDDLAPPFEERAARLVAEPWRAREDYIDLLLDGGETARGTFLERHARRALDPAERTELLSLLELQRHAMLIYTSCGWFFEDLARIEPIQLLRYARRAVELAQGLGFPDPEPELLERLEAAQSNRPERGTGRDLYLRHAVARKPAE